MARAMSTMLAALAVCAFFGIFPHEIVCTVPISGPDGIVHDNARNAHVTADLEEMYGHTVLKEDITTDQKKFHNIIMNLKFDDQKNGFRPDMSMKEFYEFARKSELFQLIDAMPKLGVLRAHIASMLGPDFLLEQIKHYTNEGELYVYSKSDGKDPCQFRIGQNLEDAFLDANLEKDCKSLGDEGYAWHKMDQIKKNHYPDNSKAEEHSEWDKYLNVLKGLLSICNEANDYQEFKDHKTAMENFNARYPLQTGIVKCDEVWAKISPRIIEYCNEQRVAYLEVHATLTGIYKKADQSAVPILEVYQALKNPANAAAADPEQYFAGLKVIFAPFRPTVDSVDRGQKALDDIQPFQDELAGIDLVGFEEQFPLPNYIGFVHSAQNTEGLTANLQVGESDSRHFLHEGLFDALLLDVKRIGHALTLVKHTYLMRKMIENDVVIEVCPISNRMLALVHGEHPAREFRRQKIPLVISSDNPGFWSAKLLAHDLYLALMTIAFDNEGWGVLEEWMMNSIGRSSLNDSEKGQIREKWIRSIGDFIPTMIKTHEIYTEIMPASHFDSVVA